MLGVRELAVRRPAVAHEHAGVVDPTASASGKLRPGAIV
jgi:hypothetical protein